MKTNKELILELAEEYLKDKDYKKGIITNAWVDRVSSTLGLSRLDDLGLSNMWDTVYLTLHCEYLERRATNDDSCMDYSDVKSAFLEVVNVEARKRKGFITH